MLLTWAQMEKISDYYNGRLTEAEQQQVLEFDKQCYELWGKHALKMPLTPEQEDLLERCRQCNLTAIEKKEVLLLDKEYSDYCGRWLLSGAMRKYCRSED